MPLKPSILIGNRVRVKSSGMARGLANARHPGQCKICKCPIPGIDKAGKCPAVARGGEGGGGELGAGGID